MGLVEIVPRLDLAPEGYKQLAQAIEAWAEAETFLGWLDELALADLRGGEPPRPWILRLEERARTDIPEENRRQPNWQPPRDLLHDSVFHSPAKRTIVCDVPRRKTQDICALLEQHIPAELVEAVLVDGASWRG